MLRLSFLLLLTISLGSGQECETGEDAFGGKCFYWSDLNELPVNFWEARISCLRRGGDLASINTMADYEYFAGEHFAEAHWIGGTAERHQNGTYRWTDGSFWNETVAAAAWGNGQPSGGDQHCVAWWQRNIGEWDDKNCDTYDAGFQCEFSPRANCTCGPNESKFCDRDRTCDTYRVCESGQIVNVQCPPGQKVDENLNCVPADTLQGTPCNIDPSCTGVSDGNYPWMADLCRSYYTCSGGTLTGINACPEQPRGFEYTFDASVGMCRPADEVCAPCGSNTDRPPTDPSCQT